MSNFEEEDFKKKIDISTWKGIFSYTKNCKKTVILILTTMVFVAIFDTIFPLFSTYAIDNYVTENNMNNIVTFNIPILNISFAVKSIVLFCFTYLMVILCQCMLIYVFIRCAGIIEATIQRDMRKDAFYKLQELSFSYYDRTPSGWIIARITSDTHKLGSMIAWGLVDFFWGVVVIIAMVIAMLMLNVKLGLWIMALMPIIAGIAYFFQIKILTGHRQVSKANSIVTAGISEGIAGAKTSKTLVREEGNLEEYKVLTQDLKAKSINVQIVSAIFLPIVTFMGVLGTAIVLKAGSNEVLAGAISLGTLSAFISYVALVFEPINQMARVFSEMQSAQSSGERILSLISEESDIKEKPEVLEKYGDFFNHKTQNYEDFNGEIEFKNVSFKYKEGDRVLKNFNLKVNAGQKIALVGATGGGKSTIINLISRFYEPVEGEILFDGVDYRDRSQSWLHSQLSYVLQSPHLFSGTIRENVRYGNLLATDKEVEEACKKVGAYDFIIKFEKGFDTEVGEGGGRLSQGEKQLISFARAIVGSPKLFILDEATSSIDTVTENKIQSAIDVALKGRTSFIVAHRLSTIKSADRILYISAGEVLEDGSHKELMDKGGHYYDLYMKQFKEEASAKLM
ncbi:MAG: ABC transporter ATP-binding protein [Lachnospirales bacterium]